MADVTTPAGSAPTTAADPCVWTDTWPATSSSRASSSSTARPRRWTWRASRRSSRSPINRGACCHVAGDIDFDKDNNLWFVTGDDTPAGGGNSGGFSPHNDMKTNETQTLRVNSADGRHVHADLQRPDDGADRRTTRPPRGHPGRARGARQHRAAATSSSPAAPINAGQPDRVLPRRATARRTSPQITGDAQRPDRHRPRRSPARRRRLGGRPGSRRRSSTLAAPRRTPTTCAARSCASRSAPTARTRSPRGTCSRPARAKTRPEIYAMGFRNPFRIQVDENDVAYITDYSPDSNDAGELPRPGRHRPRGDRAQAVQLRLAALLRAEPAVLPLELQHLDAAGRDADPVRVLQPDARPAEHLALGRQRRPDGRARPRVRAADRRSRTSGTRTATTPRPAAGHAVPGVLRRLGRHLPAAVPGAVHGRRGAARRGEVPLRPRQPEHEEVPAVLRQLDVLRASSARTPCARSAWTRRTRCSRSISCSTAARSQANRTLPFECDNPNDMQFGADGAFYLLTYGDGFFAANADAGMYKWEYVKGQRAPSAVLTTDRTDGPAPLTVQFSSRRHGGRRSGRRAHLRVGLRQRRHGRLDRAEPDAHLHHARASTRPS